MTPCEGMVARALMGGTRATLPALLLATFPHLATGGIPPPARSLVPPGWAPSYDLAASTIAMPCNDSGLMLDQRAFRHWGVLSWDWSNGMDLWINQKPMDSEGMLVRQLELTKAANPRGRHAPAGAHGAGRDACAMCKE